MFPILRAAVLGLAISTGGAAAFAQTPPSGETLFRQRCGSCHTVQAGQNRMGPSLRGVVGRRAGTVSGYAYSPALRAWGQDWTTANLERYLAGSRATVPGTRMNIAAPPPAQRAEIIRYLQTQR
jgi:cytochrome c